MAVRVGKPAPDLACEYWMRGAQGPKRMSLSEHRGKWVVLFFYPRDFTFVCPTEIAAFAEMRNDFAAEDALVIGASTDSFYSHKAWFESEEQLQGVDYPVIADTSHKLSRAFDVLLDDGATLRATFIMDPEGIVRHTSVNDLDVGRNVEETLRTLQGLRSGELCPVGWRPGQPAHTTYNEWVARAFPRLTKKALAEASNRLETVKYKAGDVVIRQGDEPDRFYIIVGGEVHVVRHTAGGGFIRLAELGPGEIFGEIGILTEMRRTADVMASSEVELLAMDWQDFKGLLDSSDPTARDFMRIVEQRRSEIPDLEGSAPVA
ncbi:MAG TPA: redoxin domain-containing protein [Gemmatimonadota bacterium]|nr:redoxin domain-containing protein [Gemmatimonadota bacterium]